MPLDIIGLFLHLAGFVIGLGAVTVIDLHGFLGRKSAYWTEATTRTHKVTKPLIWIGITLAMLGGFIFYRGEYFSPIPLAELGALIVLVVNGLFLSFRVSPYMIERERQGKQAELLPSEWQRKIFISFIVSDIGWWGSLMLTVVYLIYR